MLGGSLATASVSDTLTQMVLYGLGMGFVISLLTLAVALFREGMQRWLKKAMRYADPLGTAFLFVAGISSDVSRHSAIVAKNRGHDGASATSRSR